VVGEEEVKSPTDTSAVPKGAGETDALKANGYFAPSPHRYRTGLTAERLRELLSYDPLTGDFRWLVATSFRRDVGRIAGHINSRGGKVIRADRVLYQAHRLAFLYMTGKFPALDVDHADGNPSNNRWENLREASMSENIANSRRPSHNRSGFKGVSWDKTTWRARIGINGQDISLGSFKTPEEAHAAYIVAAVKYFGEFARAA
jgi:hypothetical protein